jgi:beta-N-acetylhexosaminidase
MLSLSSRRRQHRSAPILVTLLIGAVVVACHSGVEPSASMTPSAAAAQTGLQATDRASAGVASPSAGTCATATSDAMTEEQRVGQLFMLGIDGSVLSAAEKSAIETYDLGSVFLVNGRSGGVQGVVSLTRSIQALATLSTTAGAGFFVGADQEGGLVQRLSGPGFATIPAATEQGKLTPEALQSDAANWGRELAAAGVNLDLAPVMDVVPPGTDAANKPIGALGREFGHDPATVGAHGSAVVRGMQTAGIATTLKHFPGLGRVAGNTDTAAGVVDKVTTSGDPYLQSFRAGIAAGAPMVMVSLATYAAIDPNHPAVFSQTIIGGMLREDLGFGGVVVSDDLGATNSVAAVPAAERAIDFIAAGGDLVVVEGTAPASEMAAAVAARAASDPAFEALVSAAALRVLAAKSAYRLLICRS